MIVQEMVGLVSAVATSTMTVVGFIMKQSNDSRKSRADTHEKLATLMAASTYGAKRVDDHIIEFHAHVQEDKVEFGAIRTQIEGVRGKLDLMAAQSVTAKEAK